MTRLDVLPNRPELLSPEELARQEALAARTLLPPNELMDIRRRLSLIASMLTQARIEAAIIAIERELKRLKEMR